MRTALQTNATMCQFRLTEAQLDALDELTPPGMSRNQAAKWLVLLQIDPTAAHGMTARAKAGMRRLTHQDA